MYGNIPDEPNRYHAEMYAQLLPGLCEKLFYHSGEDEVVWCGVVDSIHEDNFSFVCVCVCR